MSRLIDADALDFLNEMRSRQEACKKLIAEADGEHKTWTEKDHWEGVYGAFVEMALVIKAQPTVEAEPVVRCKDCKWYKEGEHLAPNRFCFRLKDANGKHIGYNFSDNDYCSHGERKDEHETN